MSTLPRAEHTSIKATLNQVDKERQGHHEQTSPQQGDRRLSGLSSGQGAGGGAWARDRGIPADLRARRLSTMP
ncbi:hypothetical protein PoB_002116500 [Plakobranchus ocellatus]|uniref:Uncharacterized protein n=1 Tax=Plakobranchus ocellatus TaxID=259542 RepID=A0AAV3ZJB5_9GAST|nr:hypothetical protein PoB_002116500 [Plakobranchus ocellatus]